MTDTKPPSLSIIIPTFQAGKTLAATIDTLRNASEIIISDGGSTDGTTTTARNAGAIIVSGAKGRGAQLKAGGEAASGDWLLFLHADTTLSQGGPEKIAAFIKTNPDKAGYFDFKLASQTPAARRLEKMVGWRCRTFGLPYGDQGLLISRAHYDRLGGFKPLPLMEDIDIVRRIGKKNLAPIGMPAVTSAERFERAGYWRRSIKNLFCLSLYFAGVSPQTIERIYR